MSYAISSVAACQEPSAINPQLTLAQSRDLPWWVNRRLSKFYEDGSTLCDSRSEFRRTCEIELAEQGGGYRDNCVVYDMGSGGLEVQLVPNGWLSADKLARPRDVVFSRPGYWTYPNQQELRNNREAAPWYTPTQETMRLPAREFILRRPTGWHPGAGTSPNYQANRLKNAQKAKSRCRRIIRKWFGYVRMWTLTFAGNEPWPLHKVWQAFRGRVPYCFWLMCVMFARADYIRFCDIFFQSAMRKCRDWFEGRGQTFRYIAVREFQERGALHYHLFVNQYIPQNQDRAKPGELTMQEVWPHGHTFVVTSIRKRRKTGKEYKVQTTFKSTKNADALARYLSKYIVKTLEDPEAASKLEGHHLYLRSHGLSVEKVAVWSSLDKILAWAKRTGRKVRRMWKLPVEIVTDRGKLTLYHYRLDLSPKPSPQT